MLRDAIGRLIKGECLTEKQMIGAMTEIMEGKASEVLIASFLTALRQKGETPDEITGGAKVMKEKAEKINLSDLYTIDTCGTGGDGANTYNISTAVAFVCAAAGVYVTKHGNRAVTSKSGSADVMEALGVNINLNPEQVEKCVRTEKIGFLFAPNFHKAMKYAIGVRRELAFRTIFNILGPLTNPASAKGQVVGVFNPDLNELMAESLKNLGVEHALVVHGMDGLDEFTLTDETKVTELKNGEIKTYFVDPEEFGFEPCTRKELLGGDAQENAKIIKDIFDGKITGAKKNVLLLNAGAALYVGNKVKNIEEGIKMAGEIIDNGLAKAKLESFVRFTRSV